jgi:hypothetical protein
MDPDFNKRDSFHATIEHPHMSAEEWTEVYEDAWKTFYSKENMIKILSRWNHNPKVVDLFLVQKRRCDRTGAPDDRRFL